MGKGTNLPVSGNGPSSYSAYSSPKLRTVPASHPTSNLVGRPGSSSSNTDSNSSTLSISLKRPLFRPPPSPTWTPEMASSFHVLRLFCNALPVMHSSMNDIAKMSISHTTFSLKPFRSVPATLEIKSRLLAMAVQALSELGHSRCSVNNIELLQPHISQFSCCSSSAPCTMDTSAPRHSWPGPTLGFGYWLSLCQEALPVAVQGAVCSPTTQGHTAKCWPRLVA